MSCIALNGVCKANSAAFWAPIFYIAIQVCRIVFRANTLERDIVEAEPFIKGLPQRFSDPGPNVAGNTHK